MTPLGGNPLVIVLHFTIDISRFPAQDGGDQARYLRRRGYAAIPGLDRDAGTAARMSSRMSALVRGSVDGFDLEVLRRTSSGCASSGEDLIMSSNSGSNEP